MKFSTQKVIVFQAGIIKLCNQDDISEVQQNNITTGSGEIAQRLTKLEKYIKSEEFTANLSTNIEQNVEKPKAQVEKTKIKIPLGKTQDYWSQVVEEFKKNRKMTIYTSLMNTTAKEINEDTIGIEFNNGLTPFGKTVLEASQNMKEICDLVSQACGRPMNVKYIDNNIYEVVEKDNEKVISDFANGNGIPFSITE